MISFKSHIHESDDNSLVTEAFNSAPYELTFGKKSAGDVFFTFTDEDNKEFRIQFYTPQGLGKSVRQVYIGTKKGASYLDAQQKFKNPMKVIATLIEAMKQFLQTPLGKSIDGYAVNFSKKAFDRGMTIIPKVIRQSGLKQKLNVMDLTFTPDDSRGFIWVLKKGMDPAQVFNGPKLKGVTWDDPDKVGDAPPVVQTLVGWYNEVAPAGNPSISCYDKKGKLLGGIGIRFSPTYGLYSGSSTAVQFKEIEGSDLDVLAKNLKLPTIPNNIKDIMIKKSDVWWRSKGFAPVSPSYADKNSIETNNTKQITDLIKKPNYSSIKLKFESGVAVLSYTIGRYSTNIDGWTIEKHIDLDTASGKVILDTRVMDERGIRKSTNQITYPYQEDLPQKLATNFEKQIDEVARQISYINDDSYNKTGNGMTGFTIDKDGLVRLDGANISDRRYGNSVMNKIMSMNDDAERSKKDEWRRARDEINMSKLASAIVNSANAKPTKSDLSSFDRLDRSLGKAKAAPQNNKKVDQETLAKINALTKDITNVEWDVGQNGDGQLYAGWNIVFEQGTAIEVYRANVSSVNKANTIMKTILQTFVSEGYACDLTPATVVFTTINAEAAHAEAVKKYGEEYVEFGYDFGKMINASR